MLFSLAVCGAVLARVLVASAAAPLTPLELAFPGVPAAGLEGRQPKDVAPLTLVSASTRGNPSAVEVIFSAPVAGQAATNPANYVITPPAAVTRAVLGSAPGSVLLTAAPLPASVLHTLRVTNVQDTESPPNTLPAGSQVPIVKAQGVITRNYFSNIGGGNLSDLTNNPAFPLGYDWFDVAAPCEALVNIGDNYGVQLHGFVHPPVTGDYIFYLAADERGALFLSPDVDPAHKVLIASAPNPTGSRQWNASTNQQSAAIRLEAGRAYYLEALMKEGGGSDNLAVTWRMRGMPAPFDGDSPIPGPFLSSIAPSGPASILVPPADLTVDERQPAVFRVVASGTPPYSYQWFRNGIAIPGATGTNYTLASATLADNGALYSAAVSNAFSGLLSASALLAVRPDTTPPGIHRLSGGPTRDRVVVTFSEPVTPATAIDPLHYALNGGLSVLGAKPMPDQSNVVLFTSLQTTGQLYTLTVTGVTDQAGAPNAASASSSFAAWVLSRGFVRREVFQGISGGGLADLLNTADFPDNPDAADYVSQAEAPQNIGGNLGERLVGLVLPPASGYYTFYLYSADQGALYLSTDDTPARKRLIASEPQWNSYRYWTGTDRRTPTAPENRSLPVYLEAGRGYYFEALMKDVDGDNRLGVTWQAPGAAPPANGDLPVQGSVLAAYASPLGAALAVTQQPSSLSVPEGVSTNFSLVVTSSFSPVFYQWQKNGADIPGANAATYTTPRMLRADNGARFRCVASIPGAMLTSAEVALTVVPDVTPPQAVSAATLAGWPEAGLCFDELMDPAGVTNPANYQLSTGAVVTRAALRPDGRSVALSLSSLSFTNFTLTLRNLKDLAGNPLAGSGAVPVEVQPFENRDIGNAGDPSQPSSVFTCRAGEIEITASGSDIWNNADGMNFTYQPVQGDFDTRVRIGTYSGGGRWSRAGLMARQSLAPGSPHVNVTAFRPTGANSYEAHYRGSEGAATGAWPNGNTYGFPGVPVPNAWVRLARSNDVFTAYASSNAVDWIRFSQMTFGLSNLLYVGLATSGQMNDNPGVFTSLGYRDVAGVSNALAAPALDLLIKPAAAGPGAWALDNVFQFQPSGGQVVSQWANPTNPALFTVQVQNPSALDLSCRLVASDTRETNWTAVFRLGSTDITSQITNAAGYVFTNLAAGASEFVTVELLPNGRALGGASRSVILRAFTDARAVTPRDSVQALARNEFFFQPDLQVRRLTDAIYAGDGVLNSTGSNQTKSLRGEVGAVARYPLKLVNTGNATNQFKLQATPAAAGWVARYYDAVSGGTEITGDISGSGAIVSLVPGGSWEFMAEVQSDATLAGGASNILAVTAVSTANPNRSDTVKIVTATYAPTNAPQSRLYTLDGDFEEGTLVGTAYSGNQLSLSDRAVVPPYIWVPNSDVGSVSKVDIRTGREVARYRTCPAGINGQPSRTTIDQNGNCWVANRQSGTVVKIGLYENGQYLDRNTNGLIETSQDLNGDGDITGSELLPWGEDECVLFEIVVIPGKEGTFVPGTYFNGYVDAYWNPGPRGIAVDAQGNVWAGTHDSMKYYLLEGSTAAILYTNDTAPFNHTAYGGVIDANGLLWSSGYKESGQNNVLRWDPVHGTNHVIDFDFHTYGLGLDRSNHLFVSGHQEGRLARLDVLTSARDWTVGAGYRSRGVAVTPDGDVWVVSSGEGNVWRFSSEGVFKTKIGVGAEPTGVSIDSEGRVWVVNWGDEYIHRIDPATDSITLSKRIVGAKHYGYSDMTGAISRNTTLRYGTWLLKHDSRMQFTPWGRVTWHGYEPASDSLRVRVRSSNDGLNWSPWETAANGAPLGATPPGQFLQVEAALRALASEEWPALYDLLVEPLPQQTADLAVFQVVSPNPATNDHPWTCMLTVTNLGPEAARGVFVTNLLPAGVALVSATASQGTVVQTSGVVRCDLGGLPASGTATITSPPWSLPRGL